MLPYGTLSGIGFFHSLPPDRRIYNFLPVPETDGYFIRQTPVFNRLFFCLYDWGGYLIYRLYPDNKISIDGRSDLYYQFIPVYERIMRGGPKTEERLNKIGADLVLVPPKSGLAQWFEHAKTWHKVYGTSKESLYEPPRLPPGIPPDLLPHQ